MNYDYSFFHEALLRPRRYRSGWGAGLISVAKRDGFLCLVGEPPVLERDDNGSTIELPSLFTCPELEGACELVELLGQGLPEDFMDFHTKYGEVIVVTRIGPVRLFSWEEIIEQVHDNTVCSLGRKPKRVFRFGGICESDHEFYGLRQSDEGNWEVIAACQQPDEFLEGATDFGEYEYYKSQEVPKAIAPSFYDWLLSLIQNDGIAEPYFEAPGGANHWEVLD
jgi:hypothetical protein